VTVTGAAGAALAGALAVVAGAATVATSLLPEQANSDTATRPLVIVKRKGLVFVIIVCSSRRCAPA
jgi:hypothetical protein